MCVYTYILYVCIYICYIFSIYDVSWYIYIYTNMHIILIILFSAFFRSRRSAASRRCVRTRSAQAWPSAEALSWSMRRSSGGRRETMAKKSKENHGNHGKSMGKWRKTWKTWRNIGKSSGVSWKNWWTPLKSRTFTSKKTTEVKAILQETAMDFGWNFPSLGQNFGWWA